MDDLLLSTASTITSGILPDLRMIFASIISIILILLGARLIYSALSSGFSSDGDYVLPITERTEYDNIYDEEEKKDHVNRMRMKARSEIKSYHDRQGA